MPNSRRRRPLLTPASAPSTVRRFMPSVASPVTIRHRPSETPVPIRGRSLPCWSYPRCGYPVKKLLSVPSDPQVTALHSPSVPDLPQVASHSRPMTFLCFPCTGSPGCVTRASTGRCGLTARERTLGDGDGTRVTAAGPSRSSNPITRVGPRSTTTRRTARPPRTPTRSRPSPGGPVGPSPKLSANVTRSGLVSSVPVCSPR